MLSDFYLKIQATLLVILDTDSKFNKILKTITFALQYLYNLWYFTKQLVFYIKSNLQIHINKLYIHKIVPIFFKGNKN